MINTADPYKDILTKSTKNANKEKSCIQKMILNVGAVVCCLFIFLKLL